jgi:hypothetical protein
MCYEELGPFIEIIRSKSHAAPPRRASYQYRISELQPWNVAERKMAERTWLITERRNTPAVAEYSGMEGLV